MEQHQTPQHRLLSRKEEDDDRDKNPKKPLDKDRDTMPGLEEQYSISRPGR